MATINLADLNAEALRYYKQIEAVGPGGTAKVVWNSHRTPSETEAPVWETGSVVVASLDPSDLRRLYAKLREAGGERGIVQ